MAQINVTLDQDEILRLLADSSGDAFRQVLAAALNAVMRAESDEQLGAGRYERSESRTDSRNGTRARRLTTRVGTIELEVPRHRNAPFETMVFESYRRSEAALVATMAEMVVGGVSTAKVGRVMREICGREFSKQSVSAACATLDSAVEGFRTRPLEPGAYPFAMLDATYLKVRGGHRVRARAMLVAIGLDRSGRKEVLGLGLADAETRSSWSAFMRSLRDRGLRGMAVVTSDAHEGLVAALHDVWPDAAWQRCQAHFSRNVSDAAPKRLRAGLRSEMTEMFNCRTLAEAAARRDRILADYAEEAPQACERLGAGFDDAMTAMRLPEQMRRCARTSNYLERLNKEIKRRSNVVGVFPSDGSAVRLVGALLMEENDRWAAMSKAYYSTGVAELEGRMAELAGIAREQARLMSAAG